MLPNRVHISKRASEQVKQIKFRTGVNPNILCRIALTVSLEEGFKAEIDSTDLVGLEFNLPTLFGEAVSVYEALIRQVYGEQNLKNAELILAAHIDHGLDKIKRVKNLNDIIRL